MGWKTCCKELICWLIFSISTVAMLLMLSLALNDMSLIQEQQQILQNIVHTPIPQLDCQQVCQTWYSQQNALLCCDRYNMSVCLDKQKCKKDYIRSIEISIEILTNDKIHESLVAVVCILIMTMVAFRKGKKNAQEIKNQDDTDIIQSMKKMIEGLKKQKTNVAINNTQVSGIQMNTNQQRVVDIPMEENKPSIESNMKQQNVCSRLNSLIVNHTCEECNNRTINK